MAKKKTSKKPTMVGLDTNLTNVLVAKKKTSKKSKKKEDNITAFKNKELQERAKKIGYTDEQIAAFPDEEALKTACDSVSFKTNPDAQPKQGIAPKTSKKVEVPDSFEIDSKIPFKFLMANRLHFDENNLQAELRRINRKYGAQKPVKIIKEMTFEPQWDKDKNNRNIKVLVTHYKIILKG